MFRFSRAVIRAALLFYHSIHCGVIRLYWFDWWRWWWQWSCFSWCLCCMCTARHQTLIQKRHGTRMKATGLTCRTRELFHFGLGTCVGIHFCYMLQSSIYIDRLVKANKVCTMSIINKLNKF